MMMKKKKEVEEEEKKQKTSHIIILRSNWDSGVKTLNIMLGSPKIGPKQSPDLLHWLNILANVKKIQCVLKIAVYISFLS